MIAAVSTRPACSAPYVMAQMRSATGGDSWNDVGETSALGRITATISIANSRGSL